MLLAEFFALFFQTRKNLNVCIRRGLHRGQQLQNWPPVSSPLLCGSFAVGGGVTSSPPRPAPAVFSGALSVMIPAETWSRLLLGNHH